MSVRRWSFALAPLMLHAALSVSPWVPAAEACRPPPGAKALRKGHRKLDRGHYEAAVKAFSKAIAAAPTSPDGYVGRIEASLMLGRFSDAVRDYVRVNAFVLPVHPDALSEIISDYAARVADDPADVAALTGASFALWWAFDYAGALEQVDALLDVDPDNLYGVLFRGSNRLFVGDDVAGGEADLALAKTLAPSNPHVDYIIADAFTYAAPDPDAAYAAASSALLGGLDTPRVHAILASALNTFGDEIGAAGHIARHFELVTTDDVHAGSLLPGDEVVVTLVPGRVVVFDVTVNIGEVLTLRTEDPSGVVWDSILLVTGPDGSPLVGSDDTVDYWAGLDWLAPATATYRVAITSFESAATGDLVVSRL